jgi:branched-chain amino acid transport system substrate-binding protein
MKLTQFLKVTGIFLFVVTFMIGGSSAVSAGEKAPYKIGVNLALTGPLSGLMVYIKNGLILEQDRINAAGGIDGHRLDLIFEDSGMDITKMANIHRKFARNKEIKAIIGPLFSTATPTLTPIADREKIPEIVLCPMSPVERKRKPHWAFYIAQGDPIVAARLIDLSKARGYKKIFVFHDQDPTYIGIANNLQAFGKEEGIDVFISKERFHTTDTDVTPQILKIKDKLKDFEVLLLDTNGATGSVVMRNLQTQGVNMPVMAPHGWGFGFTLAMGKEAVEGVELVSGKACVTYQLDDSDPQKVIIADFDKRMKTRWDGMPAEQLSGHSYDAIWILYHAFKRAGENPTRAQLRDAIERTKNFVGVTGIYNYTPDDHEGLTKKALAFIKIQDNKFTRIKLPKYE